MTEEVVEGKLVEVTDTTKIVADAEWFKDCFGLMSALVLDEVQFEIRDDGLCMKQLDEARIGMTDMFLPKVMFRELKKGKEITELRIVISDLKAILSVITKGDVLTLSVAESPGLTVEIKGKRLSKYHIPLFESEELDKRDPKVIFATRVKTNIDGLISAVNKAKVLLARKSGKKEAWMGTFTLTSNPMGIALKFASDDGMRSGETQLTTGWDILQFEGSTKQEVVVSQSYIEAVIKAVAKITNVIQLEMSTFTPLHIIAELPWKGSLAFWIAPRVPDSEDRKASAIPVKEEVSGQ